MNSDRIPSRHLVIRRVPGSSTFTLQPSDLWEFFTNNGLPDDDSEISKMYRDAVFASPDPYVVFCISPFIKKLKRFLLTPKGIQRLIYFFALMLGDRIFWHKAIYYWRRRIGHLLSKKRFTRKKRLNIPLRLITLPIPTVTPLQDGRKIAFRARPSSVLIVFPLVFHQFVYPCTSPFLSYPRSGIG